MLLDARNTSLACCCLISITCILYIVANALPKWGSTKVESSSSSFGLWQSCGSNELGAICISIVTLCETPSIEDKSSCDKLRASQAFMIIACIASGLAVPCILAYILMKKESNHPLLLMCKILSFGALIAGIIGVALGIVFVTEISSSASKSDVPEIIHASLNLKLDASAIIGIIAVVINAFSAALSLFIR